MNSEEIKAVETAMDGFYAGYAYLYPKDGSSIQEYVFDMTPENIANFIGAHLSDAKKIVLTDMLDRLILDTADGFINHCPNQELCGQILPVLSPIQTGEKDAAKIPLVTRELYNEYLAMEEESVMAAEISIL